MEDKIEEFEIGNIGNAKDIGLSEHYLTPEKIKRFLPKGSGHVLTENVLEAINNMGKDTGIGDKDIQEQFLSNMHVLKEFKCDLIDYVNAIKYVSLTNHMTNKRAWEIVFPMSYKRLEDREKYNVSIGKKVNINIDGHVSNYNNNKVVNAIKAKTMLAAHIQYNWMFHHQMNNLHNMSLGITSDGQKVGPMVQMQASSKILDIVKLPESQQIDITVGMDDEAKSSIDKMNDQLREISLAQVAAFKKGKGINDIQKIGVNMNGTDPVEDSEDIIDVEEVTSGS